MRLYANVAVVIVLLGVCSVALATNKECEPGTTKSEDCNSCFCTSASVWACTKMGCIPKSKREVPEQICTPGTRFLDADGCNWCTCATTGLLAACTKKACVTLDKLNIEAPVERTKRAVETCTPGENFLAADGCNWCFCNADGTPGGCTEKACFDTPLPRQIRDVAAAGQKCEPGSRFLDSDGCNWCRCNAEGTMAACTRKFCIDKPQRDRVTREAGQFCKPNTSFKQDCNNCRCSADGKSAACTLRFCVPDGDRVRRDAPVEKAAGQVCVPNTSFKDAEDCNTCRCNHDGTAAACTLMFCFKPGQLPIGAPIDEPIRVRRDDQPKKKICEPNALSRAQDSCNTCKCNEDGTALECTKVECPVLGGTVEGACTPNSVFRKECNMCKCSADGTQSYCTQRKCKRSEDGQAVAPEVEKEVASQTVCNPDEVKIEGCNRCKCAKNGIVWLCTPGSACAPNGNNHH